MQTFAATEAAIGAMTGAAAFTAKAGASASALASSQPDSVSLDGQVGAEAGIEAPFAGLLKKAVANVQQLENQAAGEVEGLMTGQGVDIHDTMIATEKADLSFEMAMAVRGKAVAAYQAMMQMQF